MERVEKGGQEVECRVGGYVVRLVGKIAGGMEVLLGFSFVFLFLGEFLGLFQLQDQDWKRQRKQQRCGVVLTAS